MKMRLFFGGLLVGVAIGLMVGGAIVKITGDESGKRQYPQGIALLLALVGGIAGREHTPHRNSSNSEMRRTSA